MQLTKINGKWDIWLPDHRAARPEWPTWEQARLQSMFETTKPGDIVYYVGAEEGDMAGLLAMWGAKLVLFEPNEKVWPNIKAIWEANNLLPPTTFAGFASDVTKNSPGVWSPNYTTEGTPPNWPEYANGELIGDHGFKELRDAADMPQIKIDDIAGRVDMISLDTEGSEGRVLRGAEQTLRKYHPRIYLSLHPEFIHEQYGGWGAELRRWIMDLGYKETLLDYPLHECHLYYSADK
jgi:FkbM family methyltransferase